MQREQLSESDRFINNLNDSIEMRISAHRSSINADNLLKNSMDSRTSRQLDADLTRDEKNVAGDND